MIKGKRSTQDLIGIKTFTKYGLDTMSGELLFYNVAPTNISVLSYANIEIKIRRLMLILSAIPNIEISCTDFCECFDDNKAYLQSRKEKETNPKIKELLQSDIQHLDVIQTESATSRQFMFIVRCKGMKEEQVFQLSNRVEKIISEQNFDVKRMEKPDIKRILAVYFDDSKYGDLMGDCDGEKYLQSGV